MNILHLKYAVEVEKTRSISKAAENLYMGQPNLSRAIKELEESLGITVFKRTTKGISITPDGEEFLRRARRIVSQVDEMEDIYRNGRIHRQEFSVCTPRGSYFSDAVTAFAARLNSDTPTRVVFRETDSAETVSGVARGDFNLGIVRYRQSFDKLFKDLFSSKKLFCEIICEFAPMVILNASDPLASSEKITIEDLREYIEVIVPDCSAPAIPLGDAKKTEFSDKTISVYDRTTQLELLQSVPRSYSRAAPLRRELLGEYGLAAVSCPENELCKDVLIYRKDYRLTEQDKQYITDLTDAKRKAMIMYN
ncbi:MAG: LysR family transcriptional regulator [Oscillospiraceae bacterium]|nr:LysR family transcriptional regulator [Oscillospiraceae bacterium]